ncbi:hypothetical protein [Verrucosispora sp. NA02020]|uniref:hypothetical protein n=1 Tax=Verrucosispora sp. NA02020 TaxID=2742132 RepID=UPI00158FEBE6|nr:hypothetical protein [Verrucosispora sp. NA02020]QKW15432.1 hypothetical protein HUT12_23470 [Verrucosispora sp. NA02020]
MTGTDWPDSLGGNRDLWTARWTEADGRKRGQVFSGPRGLWYAVNSARRAAAELLSDTITGMRGKVVYDLVAGVDVLPECRRCGRVCKDPCTHVPSDREVTASPTLTQQ